MGIADILVIPPGRTGARGILFRANVPRFGTADPTYGMSYSLMVGIQSMSCPALVSDAQGSTPGAQNKESAESNRQVVVQLTRLCNHLGEPQMIGRQPPQAHRQVVVHTPTEDDSLDEEIVTQNQISRWKPNQGGVQGRQQVVMVGRQQDADQFVEQYQQEEVAMENNLTTMIERIMARNGMNTPLQRPTYSSPLAEYIVQTENPRGWKIPKYTKFGGEIGESTIEHISRYVTELGYMANNESLRVKHFPSSLTKSAFTWFTTLPPNSVDSWPKLEKLFHEQFYEGHSKISLVEFSSVKRRFAETRCLSMSWFRWRQEV
ncbi:uncharacterized protein LOC131645743 [Vicia villosa]|uniref:uncharacterized protein LOC131645743 n=1 Tax=Vicia villosa TaxID=3911 RepID=UPI00273C8D97|nr:uncharacterized protein LOC131645743 [Vicia villosa]